MNEPDSFDRKMSKHSEIRIFKKMCIYIYLLRLLLEEQVGKSASANIFFLKALPLAALNFSSSPHPLTHSFPIAISQLPDYTVGCS